MFVYYRYITHNLAYTVLVCDLKNIYPLNIQYNKLHIESNVTDVEKFCTQILIKITTC